MKIKFTEGVTVPASKNEKELRFKEGSIHDLSEASAWRWVRRKLAVYYVVEEAKPTLKVGRPMMSDPGFHTGEKRTLESDEVAKVFSVDEPAKPKRGRPKKGA